MGFLGSNVITPVLSDAGQSAVSYDLLLQDTLPSWLQSVKAGATTIWERWNSYDPEKGFGDVEMNSFNHYSYGSIAEWMYKYMAGIAADPDAPGFRHVVLQPVPDTGAQYNDQPRIDRAEGAYVSYYGRIASEWKAQKGELQNYRAAVPANSSATLYLPVTGEPAVGALPAGVRFTGFGEHNGVHTAVFELSSGGFEFVVDGGGISVSLAEGYVVGKAVLKGDVNGDGKITVTDVMAECRILARKSVGIAPSPEEVERGDLTGEGNITVTDVMGICKIIADKD